MSRLGTLCVLPATPIVLQLVGGIVTAVALGWTWWEWTPASDNPVRRAWSRLRPRTVAGGATATGTSTVTAEATVLWNVGAGTLTTDQRVEALERGLAQLHESTSAAQQALGRRIDDNERSRVELERAVEDQMGELRDAIDREARRVALGGLGWAALGVTLGAFGTASTLWPGVCG